MVRTKLNFTRLNTVRDRSRRVIIPVRLEETRMKDALEIATSPVQETAVIPTSQRNGMVITYFQSQ